MKSFWDERYSADEFVYGTSPNEFFKARIDVLPPGTLLLPCEGEGRNAVYAATLNWQVFAFDQSEKGREKCAQLAASKHVQVNYQVADAMEYNFGENQYDAIALIYAHFPAAIRTHIHQRCITAVKPGGIIMLEAFNPLQLNNTSGGPKDETMLYTLKMLQQDFNNTKIELLETLKTHLQEGEHHSGMGDIIRLVAGK
jgi:2-polyprenyl-3-methyl-5-hydroxy-6-metoxy-1,4-benzoquinol methylase